MRKIALSLATIFAVVSISAAATGAYFSSTARIYNASFTTGNANLVFVVGNVETQEVDAGQWAFLTQNLYPGFEISNTVKLKNISASNIKLDVKLKLTSAQGDWDILKDNVLVRINDGSGVDTGFVSLGYLNSTGVNLGEIAKNAVKSYFVEVKIPSDAGNDIANKQLYNIVMEATGTQKP